MATTSTNKGQFFLNIKHFPPVINGRIKLNEFLDASTDLVAVVERLGAVFAPVKYDMQGNINKIKTVYKFDKTSCLLELMLDEIAKGKPVAAEGVLWLNRALLFFELAFMEIISHLQSNNYDVNMRNVFTVAYDGSVKKYHNWVSQQLFTLICKMAPTLPQVLKSLEIENEVKKFETILVGLQISIHLVRCKIDDFFRDNNIFNQHVPEP